MGQSFHLTPVPQLANAGCPTTLLHSTTSNTYYFPSLSNNSFDNYLVFIQNSMFTHFTNLSTSTIINFSSTKNCLVFLINYHKL